MGRGKEGGWVGGGGDKTDLVFILGADPHLSLFIRGVWGRLNAPTRWVPFVDRVYIGVASTGRRLPHTDDIILRPDV